MLEYGCHREQHFEEAPKCLKNKNIIILESKNRHLVIYLDCLRVNKKTYL